MSEEEKTEGAFKSLRRFWRAKHIISDFWTTLQVEKIFFTLPTLGATSWALALTVCRNVV